MRIAFFGGTFDPPHEGHLKLAKRVIKLGKTDCVLFVPAYDPPHKIGKKRSSFSDRLAMLNLLVANEPGLIVSDIEVKAKIKPSYSIKIVKLLEKEFPDDKLQLLIGGDSLASLHTWCDAKKILAQYEIICYPRKGYKIDRKSLEQLGHWDAKEIDILLSTVLQMPFFDISSTLIRDNVSDKNLNKKILEYIKTKGLYLKL